VIKTLTSICHLKARYMQVAPVLGLRTEARFDMALKKPRFFRFKKKI